jgi:hypothetical protein
LSAVSPGPSAFGSSGGGAEPPPPSPTSGSDISVFSSPTFLKNLKAIFGWRNEMIEGVFYSSSFSCARNYWCTARSPARETDASSQRAGCHATSTACAPCPESRATRPPPPRTSHTSGPSVPVRAPVPTKRPQGETAHPTPAALAAAPPRDPPAPGGGVSVSTQRAARASHSLTIAPEDSEADCKTCRSCVDTQKSRG